MIFPQVKEKGGDPLHLFLKEKNNQIKDCSYSVQDPEQTKIVLQGPCSTIQLKKKYYNIHIRTHIKQNDLSMIWIERTYLHIRLFSNQGKGRFFIVSTPHLFLLRSRNHLFCVLSSQMCCFQIISCLPHEPKAARLSLVTIPQLFGTCLCGHSIDQFAFAVP